MNRRALKRAEKACREAAELEKRLLKAGARARELLALAGIAHRRLKSWRQAVGVVRVFREALRQG